MESQEKEIKREDLVMMEFRKFKARFKKERDTRTVRIKKFPIVHLCENLEKFYPQIKYLKNGEKVNFLIFLLERSMKAKVEDYVYSWDVQYASNKERHFDIEDIFSR